MADHQNDNDKDKSSQKELFAGVSPETVQKVKQQAEQVISSQLDRNQERQPNLPDGTLATPARSPNNAVSKETFSPPQVGVNPHSRTGVTNMGAPQTQANRFGMKPPEHSGASSPEKGREKDKDRERD